MMRVYIEQLLFELQLGDCAKCSKELDKFQLHHKQYSEDITIYDLELLHPACHAGTHKIIGVRGKVSDVDKFANLSH